MELPPTSLFRTGNNCWQLSSINCPLIRHKMCALSYASSNRAQDLHGRMGAPTNRCTPRAQSQIPHILRRVHSQNVHRIHQLKCALHSVRTVHTVRTTKMCAGERPNPKPKFGQHFPCNVILFRSEFQNFGSTSPVIIALLATQNQNFCNILAVSIQVFTPKFQDCLRVIIPILA